MVFSDRGGLGDIPRVFVFIDEYHSIVDRRWSDCLCRCRTTSEILVFYWLIFALLKLDVDRRVVTRLVRHLVHFVLTALSIITNKLRLIQLSLPLQQFAVFFLLLDKCLCWFESILWRSHHFLLIDIGRVVGDRFEPSTRSFLLNSHCAGVVILSRSRCSRLFLLCNLLAQLGGTLPQPRDLFLFQLVSYLLLLNEFLQDFLLVACLLNLSHQPVVQLLFFVQGSLHLNLVQQGLFVILHRGIALLELFRDLDLQELIVVCHIQIFEVIDHSITVVLFLSKVNGASR